MSWVSCIMLCCIALEVCMLLLLHAFTLHIYCPHLLSCTALVSLLFGTVIPTSSNILMEMFLLHTPKEIRHKKQIGVCDITLFFLKGLLLVLIASVSNKLCLHRSKS